MKSLRSDLVMEKKAFLLITISGKTVVGCPFLTYVEDLNIHFSSSSWHKSSAAWQKLQSLLYWPSQSSRVSSIVNIHETAKNWNNSTWQCNISSHVNQLWIPRSEELCSFNHCTKEHLLFLFLLLLLFFPPKWQFNWISVKGWKKWRCHRLVRYH